METRLSWREQVRQESAAALKEIRQAEAQRRAEIPPEVLAWLALPPVWTLQLARACRFPAGESTLDDLLARLVNDGLCVTGMPAMDLNADAAELANPPDPEERRFWMPTPRWDEVLQDLLRTQGLPYLRKLVMHIGEAILAAQTAGTPALPLVACWARLAASPDAAAALGGRVAESFQARQPGMVYQWIEAARPLARVLAGPLEAAVARAGRQLELYHRRARDERLLAHFLERRAQVAAFEALLDDDHPELWALHYAGFGGAGKTMLVRHITARLIPRRGATLARVDFDYLNPDYPWKSPALLLDQWAQDLRLAALDQQAIADFDRFDSKVLRLHERLTDPAAPPRPVAVLLSEPDFIEVLEAFASGVRGLPQPVVLLLDTCEELARLNPEGGAPQALSATFDIVEAVHALLPAVRVVFCGRRALAAHGAGWRCPDSTLPPRSYLCLHEVRGFSRAEAERYLLELAPVPPEFVEPILARSPDVGKGERFEWDEPPAEDPADARYNPFNLALYADWVREDKRLTPEIVRAANDERYVELRIAGRIKQESLRQILPTVAALGRFDAATLQAVLGAESQTFTQLYEELANQEWIDRQPRQFLEVDRGLRPRLLAYYENTHPAQTRAAGASGARHLRNITLDPRRALGNLDVAHFDGALRLSDPQDAAGWWKSVEARFARDQAYDWAASPLDMLLAPGTGPVADAAHPLHAAVLATYMAALVHTKPRSDMGAYWDEVARTAERHPDPAEAERLRFRALAGRIAATRYTQAAPDAKQVRALWRTLPALTAGELDEQRFASAMAAVEAVLEHAERAGGREALPDPQPLVELLRRLTGKNVAPELWRWTAVITGRAWVLHGNRRAALVYLKGAVGEYAPQASRQTWLDWRVPGDLYARTRLEYMRVAYPDAPPDKALAVTGDALPEPSNRDADRQAAAVLVLRGALRPWRAAELPETLWQSPQAGPGELTGNAHASFEPCGAAAAEALAAAGLPELALARLSDMGKRAEERADALDIVQAADRAMLRVVRRMRLRDEGYGLTHSLQRPWLFVDCMLVEALDGLDGAKIRRQPVSMLLPVEPIQEARWQTDHARWRSEFAGRADLREALVASAATSIEAPGTLSPESSFGAAASYLDGIEANHLARALGREPAGPWAAAGCRAAMIKWGRGHPDAIEETLTLRLRAAALEPEAAPASIKPPPPSMVAKLGARRAAEIALDEGELLALRLPDRAAPLLRQAREWFVAADDPIGALLAGACLALALARSGAHEALRELVARLPDDYAAAAARQREAVTAAPADARMRDNPAQFGLVPLPDWATLAAHADAPGPDLLKLQPAGWRPWLIRLIACLAWLRDADQSGTRARQLAAVLGQAYGAKTDTGMALPAEFDGWLEATSGQVISVPPQSAVNCVLHIVPSPQSPGDLLGRTVLADVQLQVGDTMPAQASLKVARLDPYRVAAGALSPNLIEALRHVQDSAAQAGGPPLFELEVDPEVSGPCWEGFVTIALGAAPGELRYRRRVPLARQPHMPPVQEVVRIASFIDDIDSQQVDMVRQGWERLNGQPGFEVRIENLGTLTKWYGAPVQLLHLVGAAEQTSAGVRLRVPAGGYNTEQMASQKAPVRRGLAVTSEVARQFKELVLCVLQAAPFGLDERSDRDREQSAYLRMMAAEMARQGVPAVLVLPSLPPDLAGRVLAMLAEALASGDKPGAALSGDVAVAAAMQTAIANLWSKPAVEVASLGPSEPDAALESALDVCLYARSREEVLAAA